MKSCKKPVDLRHMHKETLFDTDVSSHTLSPHQVGLSFGFHAFPVSERNNKT